MKWFFDSLVSMMKKIHTVAFLILLAYMVFLMFNMPPLVRSDHVSVNWSLLGISVLGLFIVAAFVIVSAVLKKRINMSGVHLAILMAEAAIIATVSATCLFRALRFFGVV